MLRVDLDAYVLAHAHEWARLEQLKPGRLSGAESDELVERYQQVATHLSVVRTSAPDASLVAHLSSLLAARPQQGGRHPRRHLARSGDVLQRAVPGRAVPAALVVAGLPGRQRRRDRRDDAVAARPPARRADAAHARARSTSWSTTTSRTTTASTPPATSPRQVWVNNAWVSALCIALGILGLPVIYLLFNNVLNLAVIGSIMTRHDRGRPVLGADPPARAARADRRLRRRRRRAAAVLVVGRAARPHPHRLDRPRGPHRRHRRARPGRRTPRQRHHRGVRDPVPAADLGPGRHRHHSPSWPSSPTCSCSAATPSPAATPATSTTRCSRTGSPRRPERVGGGLDESRRGDWSWSPLLGGGLVGRCAGRCEPDDGPGSPLTSRPTYSSPCAFRCR